MPCQKQILFPVLVNWVSYLFLLKSILRKSTTFPELALLGIVFLFSRYLVSIYIASILLSFWLIGASSYFYSPTSSSCSISSSSKTFCTVIPDYGASLISLVLVLMMLSFRSFPLSNGYSSCSYFAYVYPLIIFPLLDFQWCHHRPCLHFLMLSHSLYFGFFFFVYDWDTWDPFKNWILLGNLWLLLLVVQAGYPKY